MTDTSQEVKAKNEAYRERNMLVAFLSSMYPSHLCLHDKADLAWDRDWMTIVCIHTPAGQLTWHLHDSHLIYFHLPMDDNHWDGHTTEEKYERLAQLGKGLWKE